ncbi:MAG: FAD-dependent oxidoreductase [Planctomycetaceae bacterium]|nr:FAD-dependent oxidoreductase [Planctomycetaceae bacterium]
MPDIPPGDRAVVIVGAGPAGLTAAAELVDSGRRIIVLERDPQYVGGISRTVRYKDFRFDIGGHRFFSKNQDIVAWWRRRLPDDFLTVPRRSRILYQGKYFDYPLQPVNAFRNLGVLNSTACILSYAKRRLWPHRPERSFEDWVSNRFGSRLFDIFFRTYTEKVWGIPCNEISADWAAQRIRGLSLWTAVRQAIGGTRNGAAVIKTLIDEFQYPRLGPGMMWEQTRDDLLAGGANIAMGRAVERIDTDQSRVLSVTTRDTQGQREEWTAEEFLLSMPLRDAALSIRPRIKTEAITAARELKYRDFITVLLVVRGERIVDDTWIYVHDPKVRVGRIQIFNNWSPDLVPVPGVTCLGLEYFCNVGDELWAHSDAELIQLATNEIAQLGFVSHKAVEDGAVARMEKTYPVYDGNYETHVATVRQELERFANLQMIGRNGMHKYNNQDHAMLTGMLAAERLAGGTRDPWKVNTDAEYHESAPAEQAGRAIPRPIESGTT